MVMDWRRSKSNNPAIQAIIIDSPLLEIGAEKFDSTSVIFITQPQNLVGILLGVLFSLEKVILMTITYFIWEKGAQISINLVCLEGKQKFYFCLIFDTVHFFGWLWQSLQVVFLWIS